MITFALRKGDVLAAHADAIVVPIDGTFVPREGEFERLLGNVGRQFLRRFPAAELLEQIEAQLDLPLPLGRAGVIDVDSAPFTRVIVVSTLHHVGHLDTAAKRALVRTSLASAFTAASSAGVAAIASPVLQGGWRLQPDDAFACMLQAVSAASSDLRFSVHCLDSALHARLAPVARSLGFTDDP